MPMAPAGPDLLQRLAAHVTGARLADLPEPARAAARTFVLDTLGVAVAGSGDPWSRRLAPLLPAWGAGAQARLWVHGTPLPAGSAALGNAHFAHCLEYDAVHEGSVVHAMAPVLAAALALAEQRGAAGAPVSGAELLLAVALGVDVAACIGEAATGPMRFFRPATAGAWGAVAAAARLAGLDAEALRNAWGALYGQLSGTLQPHAEGSPLLAMQMGFNARAALAAVELTQAGLAAPRDVLEGPYGYFALFEGGAVAPEAPFARLGREWQVAALSHKPYPSGRLTHGAIDGLLRLQAAHGFAAGDVTEVLVRLPPLAQRLVARPDVPDPAPAYARLCLPFVAATALLRGTVDVPHFAPEALRDEAVHALAARVRAEALPNPDQRAIAPQQVRVRLRSGAVHEIELAHILGHPRAPLSRAQHLAKFRRNWGYGARPLPPEAGEALSAAVDALERVPDVRELVGRVLG
jgi:2-methylcitrate dehydratase PrpD